MLKRKFSLTESLTHRIQERRGIELTQERVLAHRIQERRGIELDQERAVGTQTMANTKYCIDQELETVEGGVELHS